MGETLEDRICRHAPNVAAGYYLELHQPDGNVARYPKAGAFRLRPFCAPTGTPFGTYNLFFVRLAADLQPLPPANAAEPYPRVQVPFTKKSSMDRALSEFQTGPESDDARRIEADEAAESQKAVSSNSESRIAELEVAIASTPVMITARADFEHQRMAMELAENNQELLNKGTFCREAAEALALSRAYRREAQLVIEAQNNQSRRTVEDVQSHWAAFRIAREEQIEGIRMLKEELEKFARPAPPPPPVDYTPAIVEGLKAVRDFGVAMVQARAGIPFGPPQTDGALSEQPAFTHRASERAAASANKEKSTGDPDRPSRSGPAATFAPVHVLVPDAEDDG